MGDMKVQRCKKVPENNLKTRFITLQTITKLTSEVSAHVEFHYRRSGENSSLHRAPLISASLQ